MINVLHTAGANRAAVVAVPRDGHDDGRRSKMSSTIPSLSALSVAAKPRLTTSSLPDAYHYGRCHAGFKSPSPVKVTKTTKTTKTPSDTSDVDVGGPATPQPESPAFSFEELDLMYNAGKANAFGSSGSDENAEGQSDHCVVPSNLDSIQLRRSTHLELDGAKIIKICKYPTRRKALDSSEIEHALLAAKAGVGPIVYQNGVEEGTVDGRTEIAYTYMVMEKIELSLSQYIVNCIQAVDIVTERMMIYPMTSVPPMRERKLNANSQRAKELKLPKDHHAVANELQRHIHTLWNLEESGFMHMDLHSNNVMMRTQLDSGSDGKTVVFIDYGEVLSRKDVQEQLESTGNKPINIGTSDGYTKTLRREGIDDMCALFMKAGMLNSISSLFSLHLDKFFNACDNLEEKTRTAADTFLKGWERHRDQATTTEGPGLDEVINFLNGNDVNVDKQKDANNFYGWLTNTRGWRHDPLRSEVVKMEQALRVVELVYFGYGRGSAKEPFVPEMVKERGLWFDDKFNMEDTPLNPIHFTKETRTRLSKEDRHAITQEMEDYYVWVKKPAD